MPLIMSSTLSAKRECPSNQTVSNSVIMSSTVFIKVLRTQLQGFLFYILWGLNVWADCHFVPVVTNLALTSTFVYYKTFS